jgi:integrase
VEWGEIEWVPCVIRHLPNPKTSPKFHDFAEYDRLRASARELGCCAELAVMAGAEAGLRLGEIAALQWEDVDLEKRQLCVQRSQWKEHVTTPKGGRLRYLPMTERLTDALRRHRHLQSKRVLCQGDGAPLTSKVVSDLVRRAASRAGLRHKGVHVLRHTFCSHLAMRGAAPASLQMLADHRNLATTQRYVHLTPTALDNAIRLLDSPSVPAGSGNMAETAEGQDGKVLNEAG